MHLQPVVSCMCLVICLCGCILDWCEVWAKQELFWHQDVPDTVSSTFSPAGGEKGAKENPELGGTLASNHQAANLSD